MKRLVVVFMVFSFLGCGGERKDELGPYISKLNELDGVYVQKLLKYREFLGTDGMANEAADIELVMQEFHTVLGEYPEINNKKIKALHNELRRTIKGSMRKLVEPDFPTFVPNAQSAIRMVIEELEVIDHNLEKLWVESGRPDPFTLSWKFSEK